MENCSTIVSQFVLVDLYQYQQHLQDKKIAAFVLLTCGLALEIILSHETPGRYIKHRCNYFRLLDEILDCL